MIRNFTDLQTWQAAHTLAIEVYRLTNNFPGEERYGLCSQLRQAAVSVTSNIAEGFGRASPKDREHLYTMANGSLYEVKSQLILAKDLAFIKEAEFGTIMSLADDSHRLLGGLLRAHRTSSSSNL